MTDVTGIWNFNGNGSTGVMRIDSVDAQGNLRVSVTFDGLDRVDAWSGVWDDQAKRITLIRRLPNNVTQDHEGFLGDNDPNNLIFGGSFTESDIPSDAPRTNFGWFAIFQSVIIP
jgi:hypothetical protein